MPTQVALEVHASLFTYAPRSKPRAVHIVHHSTMCIPDDHELMLRRLNAMNLMGASNVHTHFLVEKGTLLDRIRLVDISVRLCTTCS